MQLQNQSCKELYSARKKLLYQKLLTENMVKKKITLLEKLITFGKYDFTSKESFFPLRTI